MRGLHRRIAADEGAGEIDAVPAETDRVGVDTEQVPIGEAVSTGLLEVWERALPRLRKACRDVLAVMSNQVPVELRPHFDLGATVLDDGSCCINRVDDPAHRFAHDRHFVGELDQPGCDEDVRR